MERCTETVHQTCPCRHLRVLVDDLCHVGRSLNYAVHLLDVAVLAGDVTLGNLLAIDPGLSDVVGLMVGQHVQVGVRHLVDLHEGG